MAAAFSRGNRATTNESAGVVSVSQVAFSAITIGALLALAVVFRFAKSFRAYVRLVFVLVLVLIVTSNLVPLLRIPDSDANIVTAIMTMTTLGYTIVRAIARLPERRRWLAEAASEPIVFAPPFEGRWRIVAGGPDPGTNHHLIASDQRFAYDFDRRDAPSRGSRILAPIAGRVVAAVDGRTDHRASLRVTEDPVPLGNHVAIDFGRGVVFLCHLENGSVLVQPGDMVDVGAQVGRCGNSGRTSRPHLHIHAQDLAVFAFNRAQGVPIAFYTKAGSRVLRAGAVLARS